jgi:hypothetical protein
MINEAFVGHSFILFFCLLRLRFWRFCYFLLCLLFRWLWFCLTNLQSIPNHGFSETLILLFFSFMFLDLLVPKVVLAENKKSLLSFSIQISSSAYDKFFGLRIFTEFSKSILSSNSRFSRKGTFYFNLHTCLFTVSSAISRWLHTLTLFSMIYKNWYWAMDIWKKFTKF